MERVRWRVFPWDPAAPDGEPYSARYRPPPGSQSGGRFDIGTPAVVYFASSPAHAVAEVLQRFRGKPLRDAHLLRPDRRDPSVFHRLALVEARLAERVEGALLDLDDPAVLSRLGLRPSRLATHARAATQRIARQVHEHAANYAGFEWWSALTGDWRSSVLYLDRVRDREVRYGAPDPLHPAHLAVAEARGFLRMD
jgi:hypothetical protein